MNHHKQNITDIKVVQRFEGRIIKITSLQLQLQGPKPILPFLIQIYPP